MRKLLCGLYNICKLFSKVFSMNRFTFDWKKYYSKNRTEANAKNPVESELNIKLRAGSD